MASWAADALSERSERCTCTRYKMNMVAEYFGECECGWPKLAHSKEALGWKPTAKVAFPQLRKASVGYVEPPSRLATQQASQAAVGFNAPGSVVEAVGTSEDEQAGAATKVQSAMRARKSRAEAQLKWSEKAADEHKSRAHTDKVDALSAHDRTSITRTSSVSGRQTTTTSDAAGPTNGRVSWADCSPEAEAKAEAKAEAEAVAARRRAFVFSGAWG